MSATKDVTAQTDIGKMTVEKDGSFKRKAASFRQSIKPDGEFPPEKGPYYRSVFVLRDELKESFAGRYHLYVSYACRKWISVLQIWASV